MSRDLDEMTIHAMLDNWASSRHTAYMSKGRPKRLSEQLRRAIDDCGLTRYRIAKETGIDQSALAKFYNGHRGMSLDTADRLAEFLRLRLVCDGQPRIKKRG